MAAVEETEVLVVGAGQAGIAMSEHLIDRGIAHIVVERDRIAERWRSGRWDSLVANGPAWHDRFPGLAFDIDADAFATKDQVADYFDAYARRIGAPVRTGVEVTAVRRIPGRAGFDVETTAGPLRARFVVAATGPFQKPVVPDVVRDVDGILQLHSSSYRNPADLPPGGVLVVGAGSSGVQIVDELRGAGRRVHLAVGPHERPPRAYRDRDFCWWLGVLGKWDAAAPRPGAEHVTIAVSGAHGGRTVDLRRLAGDGITLLGRAGSCENGVMRFAPDLADNIAAGDASYFELLDEADAYVERTGLDLPVDPDARIVAPDPACLTAPILELDLAEAGITTIIWATGFTPDYSWIELDAFDDRGGRSISAASRSRGGLYFLGLPWQSRRGSSFIWGVWHDARHLADQIDIQRGYSAYARPVIAPAEEDDLATIGVRP